MNNEIEKQAREIVSTWEASNISPSAGPLNDEHFDALIESQRDDLIRRIATLLQTFYDLGLKDGRAEVKKEADEVLKQINETILRFGDWDDGCFYYKGVTASEMELFLRRAAEFLKKEKNQ